jgi:hypothetical protein
MNYQNMEVQLLLFSLFFSWVTIRVPLLSTLGRSRIHFEDLIFNISLVTATSTRIQSEDVLHGAHVMLSYDNDLPLPVLVPMKTSFPYVGELKMAAPSEEKLICDKFNLEALTVNQVKVSKLWQTGKMFSLEPKREVMPLQVMHLR